MPKARERINVFEIMQEGESGILYLDDLQHFTGIVGDVSYFLPNTKFSVRVLEVDKKWFENLPPFDRFG